ncbi:MAG: phage transcriptional regulator, AlpA [Aeromicrobium sp.]|nr:phage transcriptional regulator, AlpA [Aeromicrobium sp.]
MRRQTAKSPFTRHKPLLGHPNRPPASPQSGVMAVGFGLFGCEFSHLLGMDQTPPPHEPAGLERLLTIDELSTYLGIPVTTLYDWRTDGVGPKAVKLGRALRYPESRVRSWIEERLDG